MKVINRILVVILLAWIIWVGYQYFTKSETANMLLEQKVKEFGSIDFDVLLQNTGKGYNYKEIEFNGRNYWTGWAVVRPGSSSKFMAFHMGKPTLRSYQKLDTAGYVNVIEICIYVDYIDLLPFGYFKAGSSWVLTIKR